MMPVWNFMLPVLPTAQLRSTTFVTVTSFTSLWPR